MSGEIGGIQYVLVVTDMMKCDFDGHDLTEHSAKLIVSDLVENKNADAIITSDDSWAAQIINTLHDAGYKVPEDVAVTGSGNLDISKYLRPRITTADPCHREVSHKAIDMLIDLIENNNEQTRERSAIIKPKIIIRDSA